MKNLKKLLTFAMALTMSLTMVACGDDSTTTSTPASTATTETSTPAVETPAATETETSAETPDFITLNARDGEGNFIDMQVPYYPEKVAFLDYVAFDMCIALDILDTIDFITVQGDDDMPQYLKDAFAGIEDQSLGGLKAYQEDTTIQAAIIDFEPNLLFTSGRSASGYADFLENYVAEDGAVVCSSLVYVPSSYQSFKDINTRNAGIFGKEDEMAEIIAGYDSRIETLSDWGEGKTAVMSIFTGGSMNLLGSDSRCSMVFNDLGFENVGTDIDSSHGDAGSYETLLAIDPEYIFVLDRDSAIAAEGASLAMDLLDNEVVHQTSAWQNGNIVELDPLIWYLVEGGVIAMETMISDLEAGMNK